MKIKYNNKLIELINNYDLKIENINDISNIINEELDNINENICNNKKKSQNLVVQLVPQLSIIVLNL